MKDKPTKSITKDRFLELQESICILDTMVHESDQYDTIVKDDILLTQEIQLLGKAIKRFEQQTGITVNLRG